MRIVHYDGEGLARIHPFEAARNSRAGRDALRDHLKWNLVADAHRARGQNVVDIDAANQLALDIEPQLSEVDLEAQPIDGGRYIPSSHVGVGIEAVEQGSSVRPQPARVFIVRVDDRDARRGCSVAAIEQESFGRKVAVHGFVKIEMILREVGEDRGLKVEAPDAT